MIDQPHFLPLQIPDYRNAVIVAKNPRAARRATSYAERLRLAIAVIHGEVKVRLSIQSSPVNMTHGSLVVWLYV